MGSYYIAFERKMANFTIASMLNPTPFVLFPKFPPELRLIIWTFASPGPRVVPLELITGNFSYMEMHGSPPLRMHQGFRSASSPPVLRQVFCESFSMVKKHYRHAFTTARSAAGIWIDFKIDTLYLDRIGLGDSLKDRHLDVPAEDLTLIKKLALNEVFIQPDYRYVNIPHIETLELLKNLTGFPGVANIVLNLEF